MADFNVILPTVSQLSPDMLRLAAYAADVSPPSGAWAGSSEWVDARLCFTRDGFDVSVKPRPPEGCQGSPFCNYGFFRVDEACTDESFARVMFQQDRYEWSQRQARRLLAGRPGEVTPLNARAWAYWCRNAMQCYSSARWASNISSSYLATGPATRAATVALLASKPASGPAWNNGHVLSMFGPADLNNTTRPDLGAPPIPRDGFGFDPKCRAVWEPDKRTQLGPAGYGTPGRVVWPTGFVSGARQALNASFTGDVGRDMVGWFERTIGRGVWVETKANISYPRAGARQVWESETITEDGATFWFGGAKATIQLCIAYLEDVVQQSMAQVVIDGITAFMDRLAAVPEKYQTMTLASMGMTVRQAIESAQEAAAAALGVLSAVASGVLSVAAAAATIPIAGWIVGAVTVVVGAIIALGIGLGHVSGEANEMAAACIAAPVVRIVGGQGGACDFDIRPNTLEMQGVPRVVGAMARLIAIRETAVVTPDVREWFQASDRASNPSPVDAFFGREPKPPVPWLGLGVAGAVLLGGAFLLRRS